MSGDSEQWLTTAQACRLTGRSKTVIGNACRDGAIKCEKVPSGPRNIPAYRISADSLTRWSNRSPRPEVQPWTEADTAALADLYRSQQCTLPQIAAYLGRSESSVQSKASKLELPALSKNLVPWRIPASAVIIARSCTTCGEMRDADQFSRRAGRCKRCVSSSQLERRRGQAYPLALRKLYEVTKARAVNDGMPYTEADLGVLRDLSVGPLDAAFTLGRSLYAVQTKRNAIGATARPRGGYESDRPCLWRLDIAIGEREVADYFRQIGEPVPESMWDWTDGAVAS